MPSIGSCDLCQFLLIKCFETAPIRPRHHAALRRSATLAISAAEIPFFFRHPIDSA